MGADDETHRKNFLGLFTYRMHCSNFVEPKVYDKTWVLILIFFYKDKSNLKLSTL